MEFFAESMFNAENPPKVTLVTQQKPAGPALLLIEIFNSVKNI